jgi:hypothetical protein
MGNTLLGTAPKATFSTQPTVASGQLSSLDQLFNYLTGALDTSRAAAGAVSPEAQAALTGQLGYQAPQAAVPVSAKPAPAVAQPINATSAFQQGVVQPVTQDFLAQTLPSIAGNYGRGAGGGFGSESAAARQQAGTQTTRALAQEGAKYQLAADTANQNAALQAAIANLQYGTGLSAADLSAATQVGTSNVAAANEAARVRNQALATAPGTAGITDAAMGDLLKIMLGFGTAPTQTTLGVGTGGSSGILQSVLGGASSGIGSALGPALAALLI